MAKKNAKDSPSNPRDAKTEDVAHSVQRLQSDTSASNTPSGDGAHFVRDTSTQPKPDQQNALQIPLLTQAETEKLRRRLVDRLRQSAELAVDRIVDLMTNAENEQLSWEIAKSLLAELDIMTQTNKDGSPTNPQQSKQTPPTTLIQLFASAGGLASTMDPEAPRPLENVLRNVSDGMVATGSPEELMDEGAKERRVIEAVDEGGRDEG